jgi:hypothetical protein
LRSPLLLISLPFLFIGIYVMIRRLYHKIKARSFDPFAVVALWLTCCLVFFSFISGTTGRGPLLHQMNGVFLVFLIAIVVGILAVYEWAAKRYESGRSRWTPRQILSGILVGYGVFFAIFAFSFYVDLPGLYDQGQSGFFARGGFGGFPSDYESLGEAIDHVQALPTPLSTRTTYIRHVEVAETFYFLLERVPSSRFWEEKLMGGRVASYENFMFEKPESLSLDNNYIVADWFSEELDELQAMGFSSVQRIGKYWVFVNE